MYRICLASFDGAPTVEGATNKFKGGLNTILFNLIKEITKNNEIILDIVFRDDGSAIDEYLTENEKINLFPITAGPRVVTARGDLEENLPLFCKSLEEYNNKYRPDLIHTAGSEAGLAVSMIKNKPYWIHSNFATLAVRKYIIEGMSKAEIFKDPMTTRELKCVQGCDHLMALSDQDKAETAEVFDVAPGKITVIHPGVDRSVFKPYGREREKLIVSAGRMSTVKDFPFLIKAFSLVIAAVPDAKLLIIGGNISERTLLGLPKLVSKLDLSGSVALMDGVGHLELATQISRAKVFAISSRHETFGLLPIEARATGTPTVVRANSALSEVSKDGEGGFLTSNTSEADLAEKIIQILKMSEAEWTALSIEATKSTTEYSWEVSGDKLFNLYSKALVR